MKHLNLKMSSVIVMVCLALVALVFYGLGRWHEAGLQTDTTKALDEIDAPFLQHMTVHHDQAITLAHIANRSSTPSIHTLAAQIVASQQTEIGTFRGLLMAWGRDTLPKDTSMEWMLSQGDQEAIEFVSRCRTNGGMPGLASMEQITALMQSQGAEQDRLFLNLMSDHHQGALPMLKYAATHAKHAVVRSLAASMLVDQRKELLLINRLLQGG